MQKQLQSLQNCDKREKEFHLVWRVQNIPSADRIRQVACKDFLERADIFLSSLVKFRKLFLGLIMSKMLIGSYLVGGRTGTTVGGNGV